jgi:DNA-damage-inducible protein D
MKIRWKTDNKPIADFMPTILLKAKDFATEITIHNARDKRMSTEKQISEEHTINNKSVRATLISRGIVPENLPPAPELAKIERKLKSDGKKEVKKIAEDA